MKRVEELFAYSLSIIIFLSGLTLIFISLLIENDFASSVLRGFGIALCPTGMIGFLFQYLHEKVFVRKVEHLIKTSLIPQEVGIRRIFRNRKEFNEIRFKLYDNAKNISYLAMGPSYGHPDQLPNIVKNLLKKGVNFRFLICNPNNPFVTHWFRIDPSAYPPSAIKGLERIIQNFYNIKKENKGPGEIDVKIYSVFPGYYMQIIDNHLFLEPYLYGVEIDNAIMIEFEKGKQFEHFSRHFEELWEASIPIEEFSKTKKT